MCNAPCIDSPSHGAFDSSVGEQAGGTSSKKFGPTLYLLNTFNPQRHEDSFHL